MFMRNVLLSLGMLTLAALLGLASYSDDAFADHASHNGYGIAIKTSSSLN